MTTPKFDGTNFFTRRTSSLMTLVRFSLWVMTNRRDFAQPVAGRWFDFLDRSTGDGNFAASASTLDDNGPRTGITRTTVTRS